MVKLISGTTSGISPADYIGVYNGSDPSTPTIGQWWFRTDLGQLKSYSGTTYNNISIGNNVNIVDTSTIAGGIYNDIFIPAGVTLTLTAGDVYNFNNIINYGTLSSPGSTQNYNGNLGFINKGTYTSTGADTISGIISGSIFTSDISIASGTTITLQNITMNGQITGLGTLSIPVDTILSYSSTTGMQWLPGAIILDGILNVSSTASGINNLTSTITAGAYSGIKCDTYMSIADANAFTPNTTSWSTLTTTDMNTWQAPTFRFIGKGVIAYSQNITIPSTGGVGLTNFNNFAGTAVASVSSTGITIGHNITQFVSSYIGRYLFGSWGDTSGVMTTIGQVYIGSTGTLDINISLFDITPDTSGVNTYQFSGALADFNNICGIEATGDIFGPGGALTTTETFYC